MSPFAAWLVALVVVIVAVAFELAMGADPVLGLVVAITVNMVARDLQK